jgi:competence protein ComEA
MERARWIGAVVAVALAVAGGAWFGRSAPAPPPLPPVVDLDVPNAGEPGTVTVHVSGAVRRPGLVEVPAGARIADAVAAAGGLVPGAGAGLVNLAAPVADGMQVIVPVEGADGTGGGTPASGPVRINLADAAALEALPGVGPVLAERIAAYRDEHGPFTTVEDLLDVPGIGEAKLEAMRDMVAVP